MARFKIEGNFRFGGKEHVILAMLFAFVLLLSLSDLLIVREDVSFFRVANAAMCYHAFLLGGVLSWAKLLRDRKACHSGLKDEVETAKQHS